MCLSDHIGDSKNNFLASLIWISLKKIVNIKGRTEDFILWCSNHYLGYEIVRWYVTQADVMKILTPVEWKERLVKVAAIDFTECDCRITRNVIDGFEKRCIDIYAQDHPNYDALMSVVENRREEAELFTKEAMDKNYVFTWNIGGLGHKDGLCFCNPEACIPQALWKKGFKQALHPSSHQAIIETDLCKKCGACYDLCPFEAIEKNGDTFTVSERCMGCGVCIRNCPSDAISFMKRQKIKKINEPRKDYNIFDYFILVYAFFISLIYVLAGDY